MPLRFLILVMEGIYLVLLSLSRSHLSDSAFLGCCTHLLPLHLGLNTSLYSLHFLLLYQPLLLPFRPLIVNSRESRVRGSQANSPVRVLWLSEVQRCGEDDCKGGVDQPRQGHVHEALTIALDLQLRLLHLLEEFGVADHTCCIAHLSARLVETCDNPDDRTFSDVREVGDLLKWLNRPVSELIAPG